MKTLHEYMNGLISIKFNLSQFLYRSMDCDFYCKIWALYWVMTGQYRFNSTIHCCIGILILCASMCVNMCITIDWWLCISNSHNCPILLKRINCLKLLRHQHTPSITYSNHSFCSGHRLYGMHVIRAWRIWNNNV